MSADALLSAAAGPRRRDRAEGVGTHPGATDGTQEGR